jgi:nicotinamidase-related amidase
VDPSQARAAGDAILYAIEKGYVDGNASIVEVLDRVLADINAQGLGVLAFQEGHPGDHALPRRHEIAAVLNRLRSLQVRQRRAEAEPPQAGEPEIETAEDQPGDAPN